MKNISKTNNAFTLIELAIVLVVIALIVGGVLTGQAMIRQSQIRAMVSEYDLYKSAVKEFRDKYLAMPGDFPSASTNWSGVSNGGGDGLIGSSSAGSWGNQNEWYLAWQHMALAGLIEGRFSGTATSNTAVIGTNVPASKLTGAGWSIFYYSQQSADAGILGIYSGHILMAGAAVSGNFALNPVMSPQEMLAMDAKLDDGKPNTGNIRSNRPTGGGSFSPTTANSSCTSSNAYVGTSSVITNGCTPLFLLGF